MRRKIAERERELLDRTPEVDNADVETIGKEEIREYVSFTPQTILDPSYELKGEELAQSVETVETSYDPVEDVLQLAMEKGIHNALSVLDKTNNAYVIDEVHRKLIEQIKGGVEPPNLKEGVPPWHVLHMTLYEVTFPANPEEEESLSELTGAMEQLLLGLRTIGEAKQGNHFALEIAVANKSDDIVFYVAVPNEFRSLFEKQTLSLFPQAVLYEQAHDYNIYIDGGHTLVADVGLKKDAVYPLKTQEEFSVDPLAVIMNAFSKIEHEGGAAVQYIVRHPRKNYRKTYDDIRKAVEKGTTPREAIARSTITGEVFHTLKEGLFNANKSKEELDEIKAKEEVDNEAVELFKKKINSDIIEVNIRIVVSAKDLLTAERILFELQSAFNQFDSTNGNQITFRVEKGVHLRQAQRAFSFRQLSEKTLLPLNLTEFATLMHFPGKETHIAPQFKQSHSKTAPAPTNMPVEGTLLGINKHRGIDKEIYVTEMDRMRHFYVIGQTGTDRKSVV